MKSQRIGKRRKKALQWQVVRHHPAVHDSDVKAIAKIIRDATDCAAEAIAPAAVDIRDVQKGSFHKREAGQKPADSASYVI